MFKSYVRFHYECCSKSYYFHFRLYFYFFLCLWHYLCATFIPPCKVDKGIVCVSPCISFFVHMSASFSMTIHLHWETYRWHQIYSQVKTPAFCDWYNYNLSQTCRWFCPYVWKIYIQIIMVHHLASSQWKLEFQLSGVPNKRGRWKKENSGE